MNFWTFLVLNSSSGLMIVVNELATFVGENTQLQDTLKILSNSLFTSGFRNVVAKRKFHFARCQRVAENVC